MSESVQPESELLKSIVKSGASISKSHCKKRNGCSVMLPPIYYQHNKFNNNMCSDDSKEIEQECRRMCVYSTLEGLQKDFTVLRKFSFTHHQYSLFVEHDCYKEDEEEEGDLDYLVIHDNSISALEVEATDCDSEDKFLKIYSEAKTSLEKISKLIVGTSRKFKFIETPTVHQFIVFTSINREYAQDNLMCYVSLSPEEKKCILFKNDIRNQEFLTNCLKGKPTLRLQIENKIKWLLLGLWKSNSPHEDFIRKIKEVGEEISSFYCNEKTGRPIMLPPAPLCKFIDKYPDNIEDEPNWVKQIEKQQREYEAEVKVYRALETGRGDSIVLHGLSFTHQQFSLFVEHVCGKKDQEEEGEIDFVVIYDNFVAVLEVKAIELKTDEEMVKFEDRFKKNYKKSKKQRKTFCELVSGINRKFNFIRCPKVRHFTIFPNIDETFAEEHFKKSYSPLSSEEKQSILFKENLDDLMSCLISNPTNEDEVVEKNVKQLLLALWCMDNNNTADIPKSCDLGKTIERVDDLLRLSEITNRPNCGKRSPLVRNAPKHFREHMEIKCLTKEQCTVVSKTPLKLWLNGPAGSGKTILLLGKIIKLLEKAENKVTVIVFNKMAAQYYERVLQNIDIHPFVTNEKITEGYARRRVVIKYFEDEVMEDLYNFRFRRSNVEDRRDSLSAILKSDHQIFVDDFHSYCEGLTEKQSASSLEMIKNEFASKSQRIFWVACDLLQSGYVSSRSQTNERIENLINELTTLESVEIQNLSANLRNCYEIGRILSCIRSLRQKKLGIKKEAFIEQTTGHFIHGPLGNVYVFLSDHSSMKSVCNFVERPLLKELKKLKKTKVAILINDDDKEMGMDNFEPTPLTTDDERRKAIKHTQVMAEAFKDRANSGGSGRIDWGVMCKEIVRDYLRDQKSSSSGENQIHIEQHDYEEVFSIEWPAIIGIIEISCPVLYKNADVTEELFESALLELHDQLLSRMYIIASRARVYCSMMVIIRNMDGWQNVFSYRPIKETIERFFKESTKKDLDLLDLSSGEREEYEKAKAVQHLKNRAEDTVLEMVENVRNAFVDNAHGSTYWIKEDEENPEKQEQDEHGVPYLDGDTPVDMRTVIKVEVRKYFDDYWNYPEEVIPFLLNNCKYSEF